MTTTRSFMDSWVAVTIIVSAAFYFFDLVTNIITAWTYYHLEINYSGQDIMGYKKGKNDEGRQYTYISQDVMGYNGEKGNWSGDFTGSFAAILSIMLAAHTLNAFIFRINAKSDEKREAMKAAYLLPVVHLRKLGLLVWRTGTLQGVKDLRSPEFEAIYSILAASLEAAPQLLLQFHTLVRLQYDSPSDPPVSTTISVAASFMSGVYNYSQAVLYSTMKSGLFARTAIFATASVYCASALLTRIIGFEIMIELSSYFNRLHALAYISAAILPMALVFWCDLGRLCNDRSSKKNIKWVVYCVASVYMSIGLGPLHVLTTTARIYRKGKKSFWRRILGLSLAHVVPDLAIYLYFNQFPYQVSLRNDNKNHCGMFINPYVDLAPTATPPARPSFISCWTMSIFLMSGALIHIVSSVCFIIVDMYSDGEEERVIIQFNEWKRLTMNKRSSGMFKYTVNHGCMM